jgi:hypothetical protein
LGVPRAITVNYNNVVVLDSMIGVVLRSIAKSTDNTANIRNSYIGIF